MLEKPTSKVMHRLTPELHRRLAVKARGRNISVNTLYTEMLTYLVDGKIGVYQCDGTIRKLDGVPEKEEILVA